MAIGTELETPEGPRAVESLAVGDAVFSIDPATGVRVSSRVLSIHSFRRPTFRLVTDSGQHLELTDEHPLFSPGHASYAHARHWRTGELVELLVLFPEGLRVARVVEVADLGERQVFDIEVESPLHNFVANHVVVHNKTTTCGPDCGETGDGDEGERLDVLDEPDLSGDGDGDGDGDMFPPCGERPPGGGEPGPPTLVSGGFDAEHVVRLTFSEPVASVDDVDPSSFRLSISRWDGGYLTEYLDPMLFLCSHTDACLGEYTDVVEIGCAEDDPSSLLLRLDIFHGQYICPILENAQMYGEQPLLAHYDMQIGDVRDLDGEPLESLGAHWVTEPEPGTGIPGEYPNYPVRVPIPCQ